MIKFIKSIFASPVKIESPVVLETAPIPFVKEPVKAKAVKTVQKATTKPKAVPAKNTTAKKATTKTKKTSK